MTLVPFCPEADLPLSTHLSLAPWTSTLPWSPASLPSAKPPSRWMFYVVSKIAGQYRPLAVVGRYGNTLDYDVFSGLDIVTPVRRVLTILSDPANRLAIESERALAVDFFHEHPHRETEDPAYSVSEWGTPEPIKSGSDEFPFISTCLLLGARERTTHERRPHVQSLPLGRIYRDSDTESGIVLVDITNLETLRYGIIAFATQRAVEWELAQWGDEWPDFTPPQDQQLRQPLSAVNYLKRFVSGVPGEEAVKLEAIPLIDVAAMEPSTPSLRDMYFFQTPTPGNDKESADLFIELFKRPHLFRRGRVFFSRAYSAALKQKFWLPTDKDVHPPFDVFPIQHVFFRNQISTGLFRILNHLTPYYVGDSLFRADTFVSGLLRWMLEPDADLRILATSPPSLDDMSRAEIKPPPPLVYNRGKVKSTSGFRTEELWPEMRDIVPGSWSVLLSWEDIELELEADRRLEAKVWKYAFVRHRVPIPLDTEGSTEAVTLGLEDADVVGIQEFLKITAPHVDLEIVEQRLEELVAKLAAQRHTSSADSALRIPWLSVLEYKEACALLEEFILKGREASMNLREVTLQMERLGAEFYA
ncbi:hypothetical protein EKO27_g7513 [Xylaria grammica]|uniref:Uncharacterized protein n=1 Tax=Xylaria grammica TaxID=363999 RepID=A0A439CZW9_9PEZI|nr:hypothetical protein EKO27_g7513 [Xylaria grammica]